MTAPLTGLCPDPSLSPLIIANASLTCCSYFWQMRKLAQRWVQVDTLKPGISIHMISLHLFFPAPFNAVDHPAHPPPAIICTELAHRHIHCMVVACPWTISCLPLSLPMVSLGGAVGQDRSPKVVPKRSWVWHNRDGPPWGLITWAQLYVIFKYTCTRSSMVI